jgi:threonine/homoserine/homoserine lactone efflux protein
MSLFLIPVAILAVIFGLLELLLERVLFTIVVFGGVWLIYKGIVMTISWLRGKYKRQERR